MDIQVLKRMEEIRNEVKNTPRPKLKMHSIEDWDDLAQARLEWNWWKDEIKSEWDEICNSNNITEELKFIY